MTDPGTAVSSAQPSEADRERARWMGALAKADPAVLADAWSVLRDVPDYTFVRAPERGSVMVRGRAGGTGDPFNIGEMTVTRCSVRLGDGTLGHGYVAGRDVRHAEIAAACDALMQTEDHAAAVRARVLEPVEAAMRERRRARSARVVATKVEFFTMVRGEDE